MKSAQCLLGTRTVDRTLRKHALGARGKKRAPRGYVRRCAQMNQNSGGQLGVCDIAWGKGHIA